MPFHRKSGEETCAAKTKKKTRGTPSTKASLLFGSPHKKEHVGESLKAKHQKKTKQGCKDKYQSGEEARGRGLTPRAIQGHHKSPTAYHRKLKLSPSVPLSFSPPIESAASPSGRKTAGVYFPSANGVRTLRDYLSNPFCNSKNGSACCMPDTDSQTPSPAGSIHRPPEEPFVPHLDSFRDLAPHLSEVNQSTVDSFTQNLDNHRGSLPSGDKKGPSLLSRMRKCKTPDVIRTATTSINSRSHSPVPDAEFYSATAAAAATKWSRVTFEYGHLQKRCQYLEAEVEYLRDREAELCDRVCQAQTENAQLLSQIQSLTDSYSEALADNQKAHDSYSEQAQSLIRLRTAYNKKAQEVIELKETLEKERSELTASLRGVQEELERERNRVAMSKAGKARPSVFTDTDTDISLNDFFEDDSRPPSPEFRTGNLSSSLNNSPRLSPRSYDYLRAENKRLLEENKKLREECEELEFSRRQCQQRLQLDSLKQDGNKAFQAGKCEEALKCYTAALELGHGDMHLQAMLHCNKAAVFLQMERYLEALVSCCCSIKCDPSYLRAYLKRANASEAMGDLSSALEDLTHVVNAKGSSSVSREAQTHLSDLQRKGKRSRPLDAYKILGLKASATGAAIKAQYRRLALQFHPDKAGDQPGADEAFKLVSQAHTILSDEVKRKRFDASQQRGSRSPTTWT